MTLEARKCIAVAIWSCAFSMCVLSAQQSQMNNPTVIWFAELQSYCPWSPNPNAADRTGEELANQLKHAGPDFRLLLVGYADNKAASWSCKTDSAQRNPSELGPEYAKKYVARLCADVKKWDLAAQRAVNVKADVVENGVASASVLVWEGMAPKNQVQAFIVPVSADIAKLPANDGWKKVNEKRTKPVPLVVRGQ